MDQYFRFPEFRPSWEDDITHAHGIKHKSDYYHFQEEDSQLRDRQLAIDLRRISEQNTERRLLRDAQERERALVAQHKAGWAATEAVNQAYDAFMEEQDYAPLGRRPRFEALQAAAANAASFPGAVSDQVVAALRGGMGFRLRPLPGFPRVGFQGTLAERQRAHRGEPPPPE